MSETMTPQEWQASIRERAARVRASLPQVLPQSEPEKPNCPVCGGMGMVRYDVPKYMADGKSINPQFGKLHACDHPDCVEGGKLRERKATAKYATARLPEEYQAHTFETWLALPEEMTAGKWSAYGACRAFARGENHYATLEAMYAEAGGDMGYDDFCKSIGVDGTEMPRNFIVLYGKPGVGKTGLAAATINAIYAAGGSARYIRTMSLFQEIHSRMDADEYPKYTDVLNDFKRFPGALVLDEVNIEDYTPARKQWLQDIVRDRVADRLPTILTCNLTRSQFEGAWGIWTFAPLHSRAWWVNVKGENLRPVAPTLEDK